jgi:hypothetical protein
MSPLQTGEMDEPEKRGRIRGIGSKAAGVPRASWRGTKAVAQGTRKQIENAANALLVRSIHLDYDVPSAKAAEDLLRAANENKSSSPIGEMAQGQVIGRLTTLIAALAPFIARFGRAGATASKAAAGTGPSGSAIAAATAVVVAGDRLRKEIARGVYELGVLASFLAQRAKSMTVELTDSQVRSAAIEIYVEHDKRVSMGHSGLRATRMLTRRWIQSAAATGDPAKRQTQSKRRIEAIARLPLG